MKNIGEKLEQARTAKGLSIKEVAHATKIRAEFLSCMEKNDFSYNMPSVYKRGFLRLFSDFLKLNTEEILRDYTLLEEESLFDSRGIAPYVLGRITAQEEQADTAAEPIKSEERYENKDYFANSNSSDFEANKYRYIKLGSIFVGVVLLVVMVFYVGGKLMSNSSRDVVNPDLGDSPVVTTPANTAPVLAPNEFELAIGALGETYITLYYENDTANPLFTGAIHAGENKTFKIKGNVMLKATDVERLKIAKGGKDVSMGNRKGPLQFRITPPAQ